MATSDTHCIKWPRTNYYRDWLIRHWITPINYTPPPYSSVHGCKEHKYLSVCGDADRVPKMWDILNTKSESWQCMIPAEVTELHQKDINVLSMFFYRLFNFFSGHISEFSRKHEIFRLSNFEDFPTCIPKIFRLMMIYADTIKCMHLHEGHKVL